MQSFDELLRQELARPATMKSGGTIQPMEAMVKSVVNNAMKGDPKNQVLHQQPLRRAFR